MLQYIVRKMSHSPNFEKWRFSSTSIENTQNDQVSSNDDFKMNV